MRWAIRKQISLENLNESHIAAFEKGSPRRRNARAELEMAVLRLFLRCLRLEAVVPTPSPKIASSLFSELHRRYVDYLCKERGLAKNSISVYAPIDHFLRFSISQARRSFSAPRIASSRLISQNDDA
jgi:hypothetical protein